MKLIAVNGRQFSPEVLGDALKAGRPLQLLVENVGYYKTYTIIYTDGPRSPHLVRNPAVPDLLSDIIRSKTAAQPH
jgi:hypothetical protein